MNTETLNKIASLALAADDRRHLSTACPSLVLRGDESIVSTEHLDEGRHRFRGQFVTSILSALKGYVDRFTHQGSKPVLFVDPKAMRCEAVLNIGDTDAPGHCDHTATLALRATAAFEALTNMDGKRVGQRELAEWLEDWAPFVKPGAPDDEARPSLAAAIAAIRRVKVAAKSEAVHVADDMRASRSALEEVDANANGNLPTRFTFSCFPYQSLGFREFVLRLSIGSGPNDAPVFVLRQVAAEAQAEAMAEEFAGLVAGAFNDKATVTLGTFARGK